MKLQGISAGAAADPRPVRGGAQRARRPGRPGLDRVARRRDVPRPPRARHGRQRPRARRAAVRRDRARCPGSSARSTRRPTCWTRRRRCPTTTRRTPRTPRGTRARARRRLARRRSRRPASRSTREARHLPRVRQHLDPDDPRSRWRARRARARLAGGQSPEDRPAAAPRPVAVRPQPQAEHPEVLTARQITRRLRARRRPGGPRVVGDADLGDRSAVLADLDQQLRGEERAARLDPDALERLAPEQLAGAVDVADLEAEEDPVGELVGARVRDPDERVRALDPVADDDVGVVGRRQPLGQPAEVRDLELAVAVGEGKELEPRRLEARAQRAAIAAVDVVVDRPDHARMLGSEPVGDLAGPVPRPVVDGDDLELVGERRERRQRLLHEALEVRLLVVGREEVRQARDPRRCSSGAAAVTAVVRSQAARHAVDAARATDGLDRVAVLEAADVAGQPDQVDRPPAEVRVDDVLHGAEALASRGCCRRRSGDPAAAPRRGSRTRAGSNTTTTTRPGRPDRGRSSRRRASVPSPCPASGRRARVARPARGPSARGGARWRPPRPRRPPGLDGSNGLARDRRPAAPRLACDPPRDPRRSPRARRAMSTRTAPGPGSSARCPR